jgi:hypothetical protein
MLVHRRITRSLALACATAAVAIAPSTALARPAFDPPGHPGSSGAAVPESQPVVREIQSGGDQTLALILSGSALVVAFAGAGYTRRAVHPQV